MSEDPQVIVVCGPPGCGKTTYVETRKLPGELMVDRDRIMQAISGLPMHERPVQLQTYASAAYDALLARIKYASQLHRAWIIGGFPRAEERSNLRNLFPGCKVIVFETPAGVCVNQMFRAERPGNRDEWGNMAQRWWRKYEKCPLDEVIR